MGWFDSDHVGHEGYLVGLVKDEERGLAAEAYMRRLAYPHDDTSLRVEQLQVGCACGWRSARFLAPTGTEWGPFAVELPTGTEELQAIARDMWRRHLDDPELFDAPRSASCAVDLIEPARGAAPR